MDTQDQELVRRHWEIGKAAEGAHRPHDFYWPWESAWATRSHPRPDTETVLLGPFEDGAMRGAGQVDHALASDGTVVGLTEAMVSTHSAHHGVQGGTLVLQGHRGHRLGMAMKVANQQALRARFPGCQVLLTGNASSNAPMNAVNDRLGFREAERCLEVQRELSR